MDLFLKILSVVGGLEEVVDALKPKEQHFKSIDEVLKSEKKQLENEETENKNSC